MHRFLAAVVAALPLLANAVTHEMPSRASDVVARAPVAFRAERLAPIDLVSLPPLVEKEAIAASAPGQPVRIGTVRDLAKAARAEEWTPVAGGYAIRLRAASEGALGLRVKLALGELAAPIEARVQGSDTRIEMITLDSSLGNEAWTPWTEGATQLIELFSAVKPDADAVSVASVVHFTDSPLTAKALAASCTVPVACTTNNAGLDAAIAERSKSVAKINYQDNGGSWLCSGTLINTEKFPSPFFVTANHCVNNQAAASSMATFWFYDTTDCAGMNLNPNYQQVGGGAQLVFTNYNVDQTLVLLNRSAPSGVTYAGWDATLVPASTSIVSISHPEGDTMRYALGTLAQQYIRINRPQDEYGITFTRGIIEGGSSGSGLFTLSGGSLKLRGVLTGSTLNQPGGLSCTDLNEYALYGRFEIFEPQIDQYIRNAPQAADDAPNRAQDLFNAPITDPNGVDMPINQRTTPLALSKRIDYAGDLDVFRLIVTATTTVTVWTEGTMDTVGSILDSRGVNVEANDDGTGNAAGDYNFKITKSLDPGTYYVQVGPWDPSVTGPYTLKMSAQSTPSTNYTDLWWNSPGGSESGWGINVNHQGNLIFATLFDYDSAGPMWLVMSGGAKQADGSFMGPLYRTTGPAFNASPWGAFNSAQVGSMRLSFSSASSGTLTYDVNGVTVSKSITRQVFATPPTCTFTTGDRTSATNYQDLWWNPAESGWGLNIAHQGDILFATLFTYDANGKGMWLVMSNGNRIGAGTYSGTLYRTTGPAFNASPWTPATPTAVGAMTLSFANGNSGTLTYTVNGVQVVKSIQRQVFSTPTTQCQ